jgi:hypothetical protein
MRPLYTRGSMMRGANNLGGCKWVPDGTRYDVLARPTRDVQG